MGGYIKSKQGGLLLIFSGPIKVNGPLEAEVEGVLFLLKWIIEYKLNKKKVVVCTDSVEAINIFNSDFQSKFPLKFLDFSFQECINRSIFVQYVPRYLNEQADSLAKNGINRPKMNVQCGLWQEAD